MARKRLFIVCIIAALFVVNGCAENDSPSPAHDNLDDKECVGETHDELCTLHQVECGQMIVTNQCGATVYLDCGDCDCELQSDEELCAASEIECGSASVPTNCNNTRMVYCGECPCEPESEAELCERKEFECGELTTEDNCGTSRTISCGNCEDSAQCEEYQCICQAQSDEELCTEAGSMCGALSLEDRCGDARELDCGECLTFEATLGRVTNALTGEPIGEATLRIHTWPPAAGSVDGSFAWPNNYLYNNPDTLVETAEQERYDVNYELIDGFGTCEPGRVDAYWEPGGWYRIRIEVPGFVPGIFYRHNWGYDIDCTLPDCDGLNHTGQCHEQDFELWPLDSPYPKYPDLFIDPRDLHDNEWQCAIMPAGSLHPYLIGLRSTAGSVNIGMGPLYLRGVEQDAHGQGGTVYQRIEWSDGRLDEREVIDGAFHFHDPHEHIHFQAFVDMYLTRPIESCRNPFTRSQSCITHSTRKVSWCLRDNEPFDREAMALYDGVQNFIDPPACENFTQGITQGWKDYYRKHLPGQAIVLGPPAQVDSMGPRWLEVFIDPENFLQEVTRENNLGRILVEAPTPSSALCSAANVLDCSGDLGDFSTLEARQCRSYLDYASQ